MTTDLLEAVQKNLGYPPLQKIDPNTQAVKEDDTTADEDRFSQAAIPAVLTALYKYVQTDEGANLVLRGDSSTDWVEKIFTEDKNELLSIIASYSKDKDGALDEKLNQIAAEAVKVTKQQLPPDADIKAVKTFFSNQRNNILLYLPAALHMGELLKDDTLDDNTNKMEGPISSLMHSIGNAFSNPVTKDEIKEQ